MKKVIGILLTGFGLGWIVITFIVDPMYIKKEAIYCLEQGEGSSSTGNCRIVNTQAAFINSIDSNVTIIFYDQGNKNADHVVAIKDNIVIDHTSGLNGMNYNELKKIIEEKGLCIIYEASISNQQITKSDKNLSCNLIYSFGYEHYLTKVIEYKNENKDALQNGSCFNVIKD